jgi:small subunit ribosomal protein S17
MSDKNPASEAEPAAVENEQPATAGTEIAGDEVTGDEVTGDEVTGTGTPAAAPRTEQTAPPAKATAQTRPAPQTRKPAPAAGDAAARTSRRKVREGIVVSNGMEKTAVVVIIERVRHPRYAKTVQRTKRLYAHDETNDVRVGDRVRLVETRPMSKLKRWRVERVLERAR